jgi:hypothetical protein
LGLKFQWVSVNYLVSENGAHCKHADDLSEKKTNAKSAGYVGAYKDITDVRCKKVLKTYYTENINCKKMNRSSV